MQKATIIAIILLGVIAFGAIMVNREMKEAQARPAVQRQLSKTRLTDFINAIKLHQAEHKTWPENMKAILNAAKLPVMSTAVRGAGIYRYRRPAESDPDNAIIIWSDRPYDGVAAGEPYGGEGEVAKEAIPPAAYVVTKALVIEIISPEEWSKRIPKPESNGGSETQAPTSVESEPK